MVDDLHRLSRNELAQLLRAPLAPDASFGSKRLILFCEPHLNPVIEALYAELGIETPISRIHMPNISRGETGAYLEHRLRLCGYEGHPPFKAAAIRKIHTNSMGLPAEINRHARAYLVKREVGRFGSLFLLRKERAGSVEGVSERTWLLLGFFLVAVFLFFESGSPFRAWLSTSASQRSTGAMTTPASHRFAVAAVPDAQAASETHSFALNLNPKPTPTMSPAEARQYPVTDRVIPRALSPAVTMPGAIAQETETLPALPVTGQAPPSASPATEEEALVIHDNAWLLVQTPMAFTIQFIAARNRSSLVSLVRKHRLDRRHQVALLETDHQGRPWYQGYYGVFDSHEEALAAMGDLPLEIQQANPFVIRISAVQAKIKQEEPPIVFPRDAPVFIARLTSIHKKPA
jgi:DamX protein